MFFKPRLPSTFLLLVCGLSFGSDNCLMSRALREWQMILLLIMLYALAPTRQIGEKPLSVINRDFLARVDRVTSL